MAKQAVVFVKVEMGILCTSPSGAGWAVALIQRGNPPHQGMWALPGGHVTIEDLSLEAAAQREACEETGIEIPLSLFQPVQTAEDVADPRGRYLCLLYTLAKPLNPAITIEARGDAVHACWNSIYEGPCLPPLAYNHLKLLRAALCHFFTALYHQALGLQIIDACPWATSAGARCLRTAYWRYHGLAVCVQEMSLMLAAGGKE